MSEETDHPYRAEYAKSGRASCKQCKTNIEKGILRLAIMVQSPMFDGKVPHWYHHKCFFNRARPKTVDEIGHFESLRWEDQEVLRKKLEEALTGQIPGAKGKKGKKSEGAMSASGTVLKDYRVELAKSGASGCRICEEKIPKGQARIGKKEYESQRAKMYGPYDGWHHLKCFAENQEKLGYFDDGEKLSGFHTLGKEDQDAIKAAIKPIKRKIEAPSTDEPDSKKPKKDPEAEKEKEEIKKQMKKIYYYRDLLERNLKKKNLEDLLEHNEQEIPTGQDKMLDRLADCMTFGALEPCTECGNGQFVYRSGVGYQCMGNISEWTKCQNKTTCPKRKKFKVPTELKQAHDFLSMYNCKMGKRICPTGQATTNGQSSSQDGSSRKLLQDMSFVLEGKVDKKRLKEAIENLGGRVEKKVTKTTAAVISNSDALAKMTKTIADAKEFDIQVVSDKVLDKVKTEGIVNQIKSSTICEWGSDPQMRLGSFLSPAVGNGDSKSTALTSKKSGNEFFTKDMPKSMKMKLKGGAYIDPECGLEHKAHVLKVKDTLYSVVLGAVDIQSDKNSYYKMQLLQHDKRNKFYVFRSWGRVGTTIGGTKLEDFEDRSDALRTFEMVYEQKTGNRWKNRNDFKKVAGKFFPLDIDFGQDNQDIKKLEIKTSKSKLAKPIQELISLIFDIESMRRTLVEFEIDLTKMPLGKLSRKQIESAFKILTEVQNMIRSDSGTETKFLDASNRFFTLIPHDFGMNKPPILNNPDYIRTKVDMLNNLLDIEVAYSLLRVTDEADKGKDPVDVHYEKLKTEIEVLDRQSEEFKVMEKYVQNTHAATHNLYTLEVVEIFKISRKGEAKRFKPFKKMHNRMLLWHGSRTTNYAGILSQGLRIAPPEAPVTGYMFGKGLYFADMVSKSANYCCTNRSNNTGLLLLCDVALGNMYERTHADYIEKLPAGMHSTKGVGKTEPDPAATAELDGAKIPIGAGTKAKVEQSDLLYNEYIVYDVAQVNIKYMLRLKFNYNI